jgi:biotin carboxylase
MNVVMIAPGYPEEMPFFVRGLAHHGARVYGVSQQAAPELPELSRRHLSGYLAVPDLLAEEAVVEAVRRWMGGATVDRVVCLWEPGVVLAAKLRAALGTPGQDVDQAIAFRNKDVMKARVGAAGLRVPKHRAATTVAGVREAAEALGYPLIIKPIAGAGSMDTFRVDDAAALEAAVDRLRGYDAVNVEEFIDGEEFTFDTICADGEVKYHNVGYYRPRPLIARSTEWISPQTFCLRDVDSDWVRDGVRLGFDVLRALGFRTGFTHMEWYRKADGEVVFGEIAARPPGARTVDLMNFISDVDLFTGYAEAELKGTFSIPIERKYNTVNVFKRAEGQGRITRITGLASVRDRLGDALVGVHLLEVGQPRRNWVQTLLSDGWITLRHPDFATTCELADYVGTTLRMTAG